MAAQLQNADGGQLAKQLSQVVLGRIAADKLVLLSYGPIAARCLELVRSSETSLTQLAAAIERDPILTVQLLREANVGSLAEATQRLGVARLRTWLGETAEVERQMGSGRNSFEMSGEDWQRAVSDCHRPIGEALAAKWSLPRAVARCIKDVTEYDAADRGSPVNFVVFANALAKRSGLYPGSFDAEEVGALELIGRSMLGLQDDLVARLVAGLGERVKSQMTYDKP
jgi:HD-like signal output (HDOD) protein